tara:strand:- start:796 stop:1461 length:666 start_codon:yes stop_codon:yes gene_type:complete
MKKLKLSTSEYHDTLYSGIQGIIMKHGHKKLEETLNYNSNFNNVLEIGAGSHSHLNYVNHDYKKYFILEVTDEYKEFYKDNDRVEYVVYNGDKIPFDNELFDRIIICQCLEHIQNPEVFLDEMMSKLSLGGNLSISLPADPGIMWRLGRFYIKNFVISKSSSMTINEYSYFHATEHINSIFNLISIIRYKYEGMLNEQFLPLKIPLVDLNLIYNVTITKNV